MGQLVVVIGLGEIGRPLSRRIAAKHQVVDVDVQPIDLDRCCDIVHICYPFEIDDFVGVTTEYLRRYKPSLAIINSTVAPGTTRRVYEATGIAIAHSPVRGKHKNMDAELLHYIKFVGGISKESATQAAEHFESIGIRTRIVASPETSELAKLTETTYFGVLIAWAQEVQRYCSGLNVQYDEVVDFFLEIGYLPPVKYFPGVIGGHCVMPNIEILRAAFPSEILNAIRTSNGMTKELPSEEKPLDTQTERVS